MVKDRLKLGTNGTHLLLLDNNNKPLKGQIELKLTDTVNEIPVVNLLLQVDLSEIIDLREDKSKRFSYCELISKYLNKWRKVYLING